MKLYHTGATLNILSNVSVNLNTNYIRTTSGTINLGQNVSITPEIFAYSSNTLKGLYSDIETAVSYTSTLAPDSYTINVNGGSHSISDDLSIGSTQTLNLDNSYIDFSSGKYLTVDGGNLTADGATFTGTLGTWGGIKYNSGSTGSIDDCTISNATNGVFLNGSNRTISNCTITNCANGIRCSNCVSPALESNTISGGNYGIYNYNSDPKIVENTISSGTSGIFNYNSSPNIGDNEITGTGSSIYCDNSSSPNMATVEGNSVSNYCHASSYIGVGIIASDNSHPVFGATECGGNYGNNIFDYSSCFAFAYAEDGCSIYAPHNWWGSSSPSASMFFEDGGEITYEPYLTTIPSSMPGLSPENNLYDTRMMLASAGTDTDSSSVEDGSLDLTQYYNDQWDLSTKIEFIRYLYTIGEANGVADLCKDIITEYPYQTGAFTALDMIYQISKNDKIKKNFDKDMLKTYLKTF